MSVWGPLLVTSLLGVLATLMGLGLYRFSEGAIRRKGLRFSGAAAIAIAAFLGLTRFYTSLSSQSNAETEKVRDRVKEAQREYDICREQEVAFACKSPADTMRNECASLIEQ